MPRSRHRGLSEHIHCPHGVATWPEPGGASSRRRVLGLGSVGVPTLGLVARVSQPPSGSGKVGSVATNEGHRAERVVGFSVLSTLKSIQSSTSAESLRCPQGPSEAASSR